jgi:uncharacterized repeat protein (TIGR01451 family)
MRPLFKFFMTQNSRQHSIPNLLASPAKRGNGPIRLLSGLVDLYKGLKKSAISLFLISFILLLTSAAHAAWYDNNWPYRKAITIDGSQVVGGPHVDFPVLISITDTDLSAARADGNDLLFTLDDGTTKLDHEIEDFDNGTGVLVAWVRIPAPGLTNGSDQTIYLYYGYATVPTNQQNAPGVWDPNYIGVWHLREEQAGTGALNLYQDSTSNPNDGDDFASAAGQSGKIDGGQEFDGTDDYINAGSDASIDNIFVGGGTLSAWINPTGWGESGEGRIGDKAGSTGGGWFFRISDGITDPVEDPTQGFQFMHGFSGTRGKWNSPDFTISLGAWQHVAVNYDKGSDTNDPILYINGVPVAVTTSTAPSGTAVSDAARDFWIANTSGSTNRTFDGFIDEVRVTNKIVPAAWIQTEYNNQNNPGEGGFLKTLGPQEGGNVLMIIGVGGPNASDINITNYLTTNGLNVFYAYDTDTTVDYQNDIATNNINVVFVSDSSLDTNVGTKTANLNVGVVMSNRNNWSENNLSELESSTAGTDINVVDNSHYITSPFSTGSLTVYNTFPVDVGFGENLGAGGLALARNPIQPSEAAIVVYEKDALLYGGSPAPERRAGIFTLEDSSTWNANAFTLLLRTIQWGAYQDGFVPAADSTPPDDITDLAAGSPTGNSINLTWTAPGDDGATGTATAYEIRYATSQINNDTDWNNATVFGSPPVPQAAGTPESVTVTGLSGSTTYFFAIKTVDEVPNQSGLSNSPSAATLAGPVGHWTLDEGAGPTASDVSGTGNDGTYNNDVALDQDGACGSTNSAIYFDGDSDADEDYIQIPHDPAYLLDNGSVSLWVRPDQLGGTIGLFSKDEPGGGTGGHLTISIEGTAVRMRLQEADNTSHQVLGGTLVENTWYNIVGTWGSGGMKLYIDGVEVDTDPYTGGTTAGTGNTLPIYLGAHNMLAGGLTGFLKGYLDDVRIYDSALDITEAQTLAGCAPGDKTAPAMVSDLGTGTITTNSIELTWTAVGDDNGTGTAASYDIRYSTNAIDAFNWDSATPATGEPVPAAAGTPESFTVNGLSAGTTYYFAIKVGDEIINWSSVSNSPSAATTAAANCAIDPAGTYIEAENFVPPSVQDGPQATYTFSIQADGAANGGQYLLSDNGGTDATPQGWRVDIPVYFTTGGTYYIWMRANDGAAGGDSTFWGIDGAMVGALTQAGTGWEWTTALQLGTNNTVVTAGLHTINLWVREGGQQTDGILISTNANPLGLIEGSTVGIPGGATVIDPNICLYDISGTIFEDVNYGGGTGRNLSAAQADAGAFSIERPGARVELYDEFGNYIEFATTAGDGTYSFTGKYAAKYIVRVVNDTVTSSRTGSDGSELAVQTYRIDGDGEGAGTGATKVGGEQPVDVDAPQNSGSDTLAALQAPAGEYTQSIVTMDITGGNVNGVDFGFNFDTIVNTNDTGQGSLRRFINNANVLSDEAQLDQDGQTAGRETSIFMIPDTADPLGRPADSGYGGAPPDGGSGNAFVITVATALPTISSANMTIDGFTQTSLTGDSNPATAEVTTGPEVIVNHINPNGPGFEVTGANTTIKGVGVNGVGQDAEFDRWVGIWVNQASGTVVDTVTLTNNACDGIYLYQADNIQVLNSVSRANGTGANVCDGITPYESTNVTVSNNQAIGNTGYGIDIQDGVGLVVTGNLAKNNGLGTGGEESGIGLRSMFAPADSDVTIQNNILTGNTAHGISIEGTWTDVSITGNSIYGNTGLGIDINDDGITANDGGDVDTGTNDLLNFPVINSATESGASITVDFDLDVAVGWHRIEFFKNPSGADGSGNGEGEVFVSSVVINHTGSGSENFSHSFSGWTGDIITATNTECTDGASCNTLGNSSEFSAAVTTTDAGGSCSVDVSITADSDDAEEDMSNNSVTLGSSDLELIDDGTDQEVGLRFVGVAIPNGATITDARVEFTAEETPSSVATALTFYAQATDSALTFEATGSNISGRLKTGASVPWNPVPAWNTDGEQHQSPNLATIIKEVIDRPGWSSGNDLAIIITGTSGSWRVAEAHDKSGGTPARLLVVCAGGRDISGTVFEDVNFAGTAADFDGGATDLALANVDVELYDNTDVYITSTTTDGSGNFTFAGIGDGTYKVRVRSTTIGDVDTPPAGGLNGTVPGTWPYPLAEMTWGNGSALIGGQNAAVDDTATGDNAGPGDTYLSVTVSGSDVTGVNFGFAYNLIVNTADGGGLDTARSQQGSLRQFIKNGNAIGTAGGTTANSSEFAIPNTDPGFQGLPNNEFTIQPVSALPTIVDPLVLDGSTQTGASCDAGAGQHTLLIEVNGALAGGATGITANSGSTTIRGLVVNGFAGSDGIELSGPGGYTLECNFVGTDVTGMAADANGTNGILFIGLSGAASTVGGSSPAQRNLVSGNGSSGITASGWSAPGISASIIIQGNYLGTNLPGTAAVPNGSAGVNIEYSSNHTIGGPNPGEGNVLSGNIGVGILLNGRTNGSGTQTLNNLVEGNLIGTTADGLSPLGNAGWGIHLIANRDGGSLVGSNIIRDNVIAATTTFLTYGHGIGLTGATDANVIEDNFIGTDRTATVDLGNILDGIMFTDDSGFVPSGDIVRNNTIRYNANNGVTIIGGGGIQISSNQIFDNGALGIDLTDDGVTLNDSGDPDTGANNLYNFPVLESAEIIGADLVVKGFAQPGDTIELFISDGDATGFGEGQTFLTTLVEGSGADTDATTDTYGPGPVNGLSQGTDTTNRFEFTINPIPGGVAGGTDLTATATDGSDNTSEFSGVVTVTAPPPWYDPNWTYRKPVNLDGTNFCQTVSAFPVPIILSGDTDLQNYAQAGGFDILFTTDDGVTKLAHEIETFTKASGDLTAWVKLDIVNGVDQTIYMYYGYGSAPNQQNAPGVWDADFTGVWHLDEDQAGTGLLNLYQDSTSNNFHGDDQVSATGKNGKIGAGQEFDGADDFIDLGTTTFLDGRSAFTFTAWVNIDTVPGVNEHYGIYGRRAGTDVGAFRVMVGPWAPATSELSVSSNDGSWNDHDANTQIPAGNWTHVTAVYDGIGTLNFYFNGAPDGTVAYTEPSAVAGANQIIGAASATTWGELDGYIDEVRISNQVLTPAWIEAEVCTAGGVVGGTGPPQQEYTADLSLTQTVDNHTPDIGNNVTFTLTVTNSGPDDASGVAVTDALPTGYTYVSDTPSTGTYNNGSGVWTIGDLANGNSATLTITATALASGNYTNDAEVTAVVESDPDSTPGDGSGDDFASETTTPAAAGGSCPVGGIVFSDGFESNNLNAWDATVTHPGDSVTVTTLQINSGTYAALTDVDGALVDSRAYLHKIGLNQTELFSKVRIYIPASFATGQHVVVMEYWDAATNSIIDAQVENDMSLSMWNFVTSSYYSTPTTISKGVWHTLEQQVVIAGAGASEVRLWLDGNLVMEETGINLGTNPIDRALIGHVWTEPGGAEPNTLYFDDASLCAPITSADISGTVFEDVNYGGGTGRSYATADTEAVASGWAADEIAVDGVTVELYDNAGDFVSSTPTAADGTYSFTSLTPALYTVRVVNSTVKSNRTSADNSEVAVQVYRADGDSEGAGTGATKVGGEQPIDVDAPANGGSDTLAALQGVAGQYTQSIVTVDITGGDVTGIDFGFNFDTIVNTNNDSQGSLRQFINNANVLSDEAQLDQSGLTTAAETSIFMIPGTGDALGRPADPKENFGGNTNGAFTIQPDSVLPTIDAALILDGYTQAGSQPNTVAAPGAPDTVLLIEIDGTNAGAGEDGLDIRADNCTVRGMVVNRFDNHGIQIYSGNGNIVAGNYFGTNVAGTASRANGNDGVNIDTSGATVGGLTPHRHLRRHGRRADACGPQPDLGQHGQRLRACQYLERQPDYWQLHRNRSDRNERSAEQWDRYTHLQRIQQQHHRGNLGCSTERDFRKQRERHQVQRKRQPRDRRQRRTGQLHRDGRFGNPAGSEPGERCADMGSVQQ